MLRNYDSIVDMVADPSEAPVNLNDLVPQHPFRLLIIGPSGCGKTNVALNLLCEHLYFDRLYVYAKCAFTEPKYDFIRGFVAAIEKKAKGAKIGKFSNTLTDLVPVDDLDASLQNLIIIDDMTTETSSKAHQVLEDHFTRGRKSNCSYIYIGHSYYHVPKIMRLNTTDIVLFKIDNQKEVRAIGDTHAGRIPFETFMRLYHQIGPFQFLYLDLRARDLPLFIRRGFDEVSLS